MKSLEKKLKLKYCKMIKNKRGLSPVLASVLLILLTVLAISIIAGFVFPFIRDSLDETDCVAYRDYFLFEDEFDLNCYQNNGKHAVSLNLNKGNADSSNVDGLTIRLLSETTAKEFEIYPLERGDCNPEGISIFKKCNLNLEIPGTGGYSSISYLFTGLSESYTKAEVYPILDKGSCPMSDSIKLAKCVPLNKLD
jgi:hypothetical protein